MSNLSKNEWRLWVSVFGMYVMSIYAIYLLLEEYKEYIKRRHEFLGRNGPQQYTVVINDLPKKLRSSQTLGQYMDYLLPGQIRSVHVSLECGELEEKVAERLEVRNALEHALADYAITGQRPSHSSSKCGGKKIDSIQFYEAKLGQLNSIVSEEIKTIEAKEIQAGEHLQKIRATFEVTDLESEREDSLVGEDVNSRKVCPTTSARKFKSIMRYSAFVCFSTLKAAQTAQQLLQTENPAEMCVGEAPHPKDIVWENIGNPRRERQSWQIISWLVTAGIIFFWTIPTTFVAGLASVEKLSPIIPGLNQTVIEYPWVGEIFKQLGPIGLIVMSSLANFIFGYLSRKEGHPSGTQVNAALFSKLVYFQTFQIFFVSVFAGTLLESFYEILHEPGKIVDLLGATLPSQSTTFMAYFIIQVGLKLTLELLRVIPLGIGLVYRIAAPKLTKREQESPWIGLKPASDPGEFNQAIRLPDYFLAMLLMFAFCSIAPLLCYFAGFFFLMSDVIYRRQFLFVYDPTTYSTGVYWPKLHDCLVGALLMAQMTFLGLVSLKITPGPITMATILPFVTVIYFLYANSLWPRTARNLPLSFCCRIDEARADRDEDSFKFLDRVYIQPALNEGEPLVPDQEFDDLVDRNDTQVGSPSESALLDREEALSLGAMSSA